METDNKATSNTHYGKMDKDGRNVSGKNCIKKLLEI